MWKNKKNISTIYEESTTYSFLSADPQISEGDNLLKSTVLSNIAIMTSLYIFFQIHLQQITLYLC